MQPSAVSSRPLAIAALICVAILCLVSLGESFKVLTVSSFVRRETAPVVKRNWESELGPFSPGAPGDHGEGNEGAVVDSLDDHSLSESDPANPMPTGDSKKLPIPLANPIPVVASILGAPITAPPGSPTQPPGGGIFGSVVSILAGDNSAAPAPGSPGENGGPLGGVLSALSQAAPSQIQPTPFITAPPAAPTSGSGGLLGGLGVLNGVASALHGVLGSPDESSSGGGNGLLGQLSANVLNPIASIAGDTASILADPAAAVNNLQSQVSAVLDSLPSAVAAGVQLAGNVGGDLADALNATGDLLDAAPDVAVGVADQVGTLLNAAPNLATGIPAAALSAVNQVESIMGTASNVGGDVMGVLGGLKNDLSNAVANAVPEVSSLAAVVGSQVVGVLPSGLQPLVSGALSSIQNDVGGLMCQVSDIVSGTALVFGVPCNPTSAAAGAPPLVSASLTIVESLPVGPTQSLSAAPQLASMLSSLSSSILGAAPTAAPTGSLGAHSVANSALSGLSSLISQISQLSLTVATSTLSAPAFTSSKLSIPRSDQRDPFADMIPSPAPPIATPTPAAVQTTIYHVQTITALITATAVQTSVVTMCPTAVSSSFSAPGGSLGWSTAGAGGSAPGSGGFPVGSGGNSAGCGGAGAEGGGNPLGSGEHPGEDGSEEGSCPGQGYTCDGCLDGWFCPPMQTPALPAPCGYGWPCYHCEDGWFCVPVPSAAGYMHARSTPTPTSAKPTSNPATANSATESYQYVGCYQDDQGRALRDAQLLKLTGGMTNEGCVSFCRGQGFTLAGTEDGSRCFCGTTLLDSTILGDKQCNVSCAGDHTNSTMCGGSWALSIWSPDGSIQQGQSLNNHQLLDMNTSNWQNPAGVGDSGSPITVTSNASPSLASPSNESSGPSPSIDMSGLEAAIFSVVASEAGGVASKAPASAGGLIQSVSLILNNGMSSVAGESSLTMPTSNGPSMSGPTDTMLGPGPVVPSTSVPATYPAGIRTGSIPSSATVVSGGMGARDAADGGRRVPDGGIFAGDAPHAAVDGASHGFPTLPGASKGRRSFRRRAHWA